MRNISVRLFENARQCVLLGTSKEEYLTLKELDFYRSNSTFARAKDNLKKKKKKGMKRARPMPDVASRRAAPVGSFRIAKPVLVCAIRIPSITDNLDRLSRPFSHPQTECFAF